MHRYNYVKLTNKMNNLNERFHSIFCYELNRRHHDVLET